MNKKTAILSIVLFLGACGESKIENAPSIANKVERSALTLNDGSKITYNGELLYSVDRNSNSRLNKINVKTGSKLFENAIFTQLSALGYTRAVMESKDNIFKVHYYKKDQPTIGSVYQEVTTANETSTNLSIYWEIK